MVSDPHNQNLVSGITSAVFHKGSIMKATPREGLLSFYKFRTLIDLGKRKV